jgi:electron transfer flavoprotein alpha subunit
MSSILVVQQAGRNRISLEALAAGRVLASLTGLPLETAAIGDPNATVFIENSGPPPASAHAIQHPLLDHYSADGYVLAFEQLIRKLAPAYIVFPHTYQVRDYVPRLATRFGQVLIGDVAAIEPGAAESGPTFVRQLFQGKLNGTYRHHGDGPCFVSVQAGAFPAPGMSQGSTSVVKTRMPGAPGLDFQTWETTNQFFASHSPSSTEPQMPQEKSGALAPEGPTPIEVFTPTIQPAHIRTTASAPFRATSQTVDLASAQLIVSIGRGIRDAANIPLAQALADALGAELAASRPICDAGWLPMERQVGSSGQTVAPKLYLAIGISGAIQHLVGIKASQCIVAINKDPHAPILEIADYAIVGDLFEIVPALTAAIKAAMA